MAKRLARKCKNSFRNSLKRLQTHVIPSEVEAATQRTKFARPGFQSRRITARQRKGILRLCCASLRMTPR